MAIYDVIKVECEKLDSNTFVYKYPREDFNTGSQLIVHEAQEAIFFRDGKALDHFGPGKYTLDTESLPFMKSFFKVVAKGESQFHCEVYFFNLQTIMGVKWGTDSKVRMFDPASGLHLELGAYGECNIRINDCGKVLQKILGTGERLRKEDVLDSNGYSTSSVSSKFRSLIMTKVKSFLPKAIRENNIDILEVDEYLDEISEYIKEEINKVFETYGFTLSEFFVTNIATPDDNKDFKALKQQHADRYIKVQEQRIEKEILEAKKQVELVKAETDAEVKIIGVKAEEEKTRRMAYAKAEEERAQGLAHAEVLRAQGGNYQTETAREVGLSFAENSGSGTGGGSISGEASGIVSDIVKLGVGVGAAVAVGKTTVGVVKDAIDDVTGISGAKSDTSNNTWVCPKCGTVNDGKFCKECGCKKVEESTDWTCPKCGTVNDGKFCKNCGEKKA